MKLRIKEDFVRLRLSPDEVEHLDASGRVEETVHFGPDTRLTYAIELTDREQDLSARFDGTEITLEMPRAWVREWMQTDRIGFESAQPTGPDRVLTLLVEKDFHFMRR